MKPTAAPFCSSRVDKTYLQDGAITDSDAVNGLPQGESGVKIIHFNQQAANRAFREHKALVQLEAGNPSLRDNPDFQFLREAAFARFARAFEVA
ncbi:hypothetical protein [Croceicoccus sp. Ery15]|uniref:hypothetical protein n=1 Tax=Croceicoccus sp. Ery15 TaxID=1703338 RepID=UPI001E541C59|nr:hypothetical protein [Croceicoccus sp. Ery15]